MEAAENIVPRKKRTIKPNISSDPTCRVVTAREKIKKEYDINQKDTSHMNRAAKKAAKSNPREGLQSDRGRDAF